MAKEKKKKSHIKHPDFEDLNISPLEHHSRKGGKLSPPLTNMGKTNLISWRDHGLHEMLWAAILRGNLEQKRCLQLFRRIVIDARNNDTKYKETFVSHSALAVLDPAEFDAIMAPVLNDPAASDLLRALRYFECLPDRHHWERHVQAPEPGSHVEPLMRGVSACVDHQSQESTDVRWFKLMYFIIVQGRLHLPSTSDDFVESLRLYPDFGDQRSVRPRIRAMEITLRSTLEHAGHPFEMPDALAKKAPPPWADEFWKESLKKTPCFAGEFKKPDHAENDWYSEQFFEQYRAVSEHFIETAETTDIDAKRDAIFGLILYTLFISLSIGRAGYHKRAEGRILLRTMVENFITLKYLTVKDNPTIWMQFRAYGTGQAKLAFLKNLREESIPEFINLKDLQNYANEDIWQEYSSITIKPWAEKNLRRMADEAGVKDFYDKYYDWASGYVHGNWGAIRDTVFTVCLNPLHRFHRIPLMPRLDLPSVHPDCAKILNLMLDELAHFCPEFKSRIKHPK